MMGVYKSTDQFKELHPEYKYFNIKADSDSNTWLVVFACPGHTTDQWHILTIVDGQEEADKLVAKLLGHTKNIEVDKLMIFQSDNPDMSHMNGKTVKTMEINYGEIRIKIIDDVDPYRTLFCYPYELIEMSKVDSMSNYFSNFSG